MHLFIVLLFFLQCRLSIAYTYALLSSFLFFLSRILSLKLETIRLKTNFFYIFFRFFMSHHYFILHIQKYFWWIQIQIYIRLLIVVTFFLLLPRFLQVYVSLQFSRYFIFFFLLLKENHLLLFFFLALLRF